MSASRRAKSASMRSSVTPGFCCWYASTAARSSSAVFGAAGFEHPAPAVTSASAMPAVATRRHMKSRLARSRQARTPDTGLSSTKSVERAAARTMRKPIFVAALLPSVLLAACAVGPNYRRPLHAGHGGVPRPGDARADVHRRSPLVGGLPRRRAAVPHRRGSAGTTTTCRPRSRASSRHAASSSPPAPRCSRRPATRVAPCAGDSSSPK